MRSATAPPPQTAPQAPPPPPPSPAAAAAASWRLWKLGITRAHAVPLLATCAAAAGPALRHHLVGKLVDALLAPPSAPPSARATARDVMRVLHHVVILALALWATQALATWSCSRLGARLRSEAQQRAAASLLHTESDDDDDDDDDRDDPKDLAEQLTTTGLLHLEQLHGDHLPTLAMRGVVTLSSLLSGLYAAPVLATVLATCVFPPLAIVLGRVWHRAGTVHVRAREAAYAEAAAHAAQVLDVQLGTHGAASAPSPSAAAATGGPRCATVHASGNAWTETARYAASLDAQAAAAQALLWHEGSGWGLYAFVMLGVGYAGALAAGGVAVHRGWATPGAVMACFAHIATGATALGDARRALSDVDADLAALHRLPRRLRHVIEGPAHAAAASRRPSPTAADAATRVASPKPSRQGMAIRLDAVGYGYTADRILHDVSLDVPAGADLVLTGPSGAGKTTFLRLLLGELGPDAPQQGRMAVDGRAWRVPRDPVARRAWLAHHHRQIGWFLAGGDTQLTDVLSVAENVQLGQPGRGRLDDAADAAPVASLDEDAALRALTTAQFFDGHDDDSDSDSNEDDGVHTEIRLTRRPSSKRSARLARSTQTLSGGEQQRVLIARALVDAAACDRKRLLILDEALSALNDRMAEAVLRAMRFGRPRTASDATRLWVAHHLAPFAAVLAEAPASRVRFLRLEGGRIVYDGDLHGLQAAFGQQEEAGHLGEAGVRGAPPSPPPVPASDRPAADVALSQTRSSLAIGAPEAVAARAVWRDVADRLAPHRRLLLMGFVCSLLQALQFPLEGYLVGRFIVAYGLPADALLPAVAQHSSGFVALGALVWLTSVGVAVGWGTATMRTVNTWRADVVYALLRRAPVWRGVGPAASADPSDGGGPLFGPPQPVSSPLTLLASEIAHPVALGTHVLASGVRCVGAGVAGIGYALVAAPGLTVGFATTLVPLLTGLPWLKGRVSAHLDPPASRANEHATAWLRRLVATRARRHEIRRLVNTPRFLGYLRHAMATWEGHEARRRVAEAVWRGLVPDALILLLFAWGARAAMPYVWGADAPPPVMSPAGTGSADHTKLGDTGLAEAAAAAERARLNTVLTTLATLIFTVVNTINLVGGIVGSLPWRLQIGRQLRRIVATPLDHFDPARPAAMSAGPGGGPHRLQTSAICATRLTYRHPGTAHAVLNNVTFTLHPASPSPSAPPPGYLIRGPSGSGKSTLLALLQGALPVDDAMLAWTVTAVDNRRARPAKVPPATAPPLPPTAVRSVLATAPHRLLTVVSQAFALFPDRSVIDNILYGDAGAYAATAPDAWSLLAERVAYDPTPADLMAETDTDPDGAADVDASGRPADGDVGLLVRRLQRAAHLAAADAFLATPADWQRPARALSQGQAQRVALARSVMALRTAGVVLWDEATAFLDRETETRVLHRMARLVQARGLIWVVVSHRPVPSALFQPLLALTTS
ncbi:hypothetical protein CXG81DRAFT_24526 [Caulochytrium protostelioides]|uniref:ABC transporter domain-containing protein n=1 Tax=Caulochytrium protostelioides TaxID=1555241 RepID=A0A4P9XBM7_9FUNG|nr:hypothetical protein CXG81DRAFT_24526 [Caulochytrium protostelioides]|eukprot:RKP02827.1 hypothetical protein CXG81DRAFT_24526 [Caulochytrium protostelioides]